MHKPKSVGDSGHPCLNPMLLKKYYEKPLLVFGWHSTCSYNHAIATPYSNGMPISIILFQSSRCGTISNAFLKLTKLQ